MPVYPVVPERVELSGRYPHMAPADTVIWERFLEATGAQFAAVAYDVALGGSIPSDPALSDAERRGWQYVTAKKIDAVLYLPREAWIVEVKPSASLAAVGQVLGYTLLAQRDPFTHLPLVPVIVTDTMSADTKYVCDEFGIDYLEFPESPLVVKPATTADEDGAALLRRQLEEGAP
jgi:hypothetical protein